MQVKGFETALNLDLLKCNVKFIFEGEEEIGSPSLEAFCRTHKELLEADVILVSDTSMVSAETPSLTTGLRGLAYWEIEVTGPNRDLHSGHFGGAVANPINVLCKLMADITDADGRITIPGFYDDVEDVSPAEREMIARFHLMKRNIKRPSVWMSCSVKKDIPRWNAIVAVLPSISAASGAVIWKRAARRSFLPKHTPKFPDRLVPHQDHEKISKLFESTSLVWLRLMSR